MWGGVIGDDGLDGIKLGNGADGEAYVDFQKYVKSLKERGLILAVCSKNEESAAKEVFLKHPDMQLQLDDIVVFKANWDNKADNVRAIADELEIGLDAVVFIDDNPAERELVREMLPEVTVIDLPSDPALFIRTVDDAKLFETIGFSSEDAGRSAMYKGNVQRKELEKSTTDLAGFLQGLKMQAVAKSFDDFHLPRIAQLINKSNQFHLTTTRYTEAQIKAMMHDPDFVCRYFKLKDRFGDNGLISVVILKKVNGKELFVDTWLMSCRILSRTMEDFVSNDIVSIARNMRCDKITGRYIPTKKNRLVQEHYKHLDYALIRDEEGVTDWEIKINGTIPLRKTYIQSVETY